MFARLFRRDSHADAIASSLYGAIVAQARRPVLYTGFGVADTIDGRFEMVVLHLILVLDRLSREGADGQVLAQRLFDEHASQMDGTLREMGVGDLSVPKRMKKMAEALYGRAKAYRDALNADDHSALAAALARNVFAGVIGPPGARPLAKYVEAAAKALASTAVSTDLSFPDPAAYLPADAAP